jgi:hypothetical protein
MWTSETKPGVLWLFERLSPDYDCTAGFVDAGNAKWGFGGVEWDFGIEQEEEHKSVSNNFFFFSIHSFYLFVAVWNAPKSAKLLNETDAWRLVFRYAIQT